MKTILTVKINVYNNYGNNNYVLLFNRTSQIYVRLKTKKFQFLRKIVNTNFTAYAIIQKSLLRIFVKDAFR